MPEFSTITKKGQVTIPIALRKQWRLKPKEKVVFIEKEGKKAEIRPAVDFFKLKGSVKSRKKYTDEKADRAIAKYFVKPYARSPKDD